MTPAAIGARSVVTLMPAALRAIALVSMSLPTRWGIRACLAGMKKEKTPPWAIDTASRWYQLTVPVDMETATNRASTPDAACPSWITRFRFMRSAIAPPNRARQSIGRAKPALTSPRRNGESVISYVR